MTNAPTERLLARLRERGCEPKRSSSGWTCRCPSHEDRTPSLSVTAGDGGGALVKCFAGCDAASIVGALGMTLADLMPADPEKTARPGARAGAKPVAKPAPAFGTADEAVSHLAAMKGEPSARWTYRDARGEPVGMVLRWDGPSGKKILPVSRDEHGWHLGGMAAPRPLYRLQKLLAANADDAVLVTEGEKAADAGVACGFTTTTSPQGAQSAGKCNWAPLKGRRVVIAPDNDDAGRKYARDVADLARAAGARSVRIIDLTERWNLREGDDLADVLAMESGDAAAVRAAIHDLIAGTPEHNPREALPRADLLRLDTVTPRRVGWLWPGRIPLGRLTLLVGRPGCGKSYFTTDAAARVTTGRAWSDGAPCLGGSVLLVSAEDDPGDTVRPRLDAHGADPSRVSMLRGVLAGDGSPRLFALDDLDTLDDAIGRMPDLRLLVVDPIGSYLGGRVDASADNAVRSVLGPLAERAERHNFAALVVAHTRKSSVDFADDAALGSRAFTGLARSVLHLIADADDPERRLLLAGKCNLGPPSPGLAFRVTGDPPALAWESGAVDIRADDAIKAGRGRDAGGELDRAVDWLRDELEDGPVSQSELTADAEREGIKAATLRRAKDALGVRSSKAPGFGGGWLWVLPGWRPPEDAQPPGMSALSMLSTLPQSGEDAQGAQDAQPAPDEHLREATHDDTQEGGRRWAIRL